MLLAYLSYYSTLSIIYYLYILHILNIYNIRTIYDYTVLVLHSYYRIYIILIPIIYSPILFWSIIWQILSYLQLLSDNFCQYLLYVYIVFYLFIYLYCFYYSIIIYTYLIKLLFVLKLARSLHISPCLMVVF